MFCFVFDRLYDESDVLLLASKQNVCWFVFHATLTTRMSKEFTLLLEKNEKKHDAKKAALPLNANLAITKAHHPQTDEANGTPSRSQHSVRSAKSTQDSVYFALLSDLDLVISPSTTAGEPRSSVHHKNRSCSPKLHPR